MKGNHQNENVIDSGARAEQALRDSEFDYHRLFEAAKDAMSALKNTREHPIECVSK